MNREKLINAGINYDEGVDRFGGKSEIYEKYLNKMFENNKMDELSDLLTQKEYDTAFSIMHDMKGTAGNLSVNDFYRIVCELVEALRGERDELIINQLFSKAQMKYHIAEEAVRG